VDFWARGAFHRGRRIANGEVAPNFLRKAAFRIRRTHTNALECEVEIESDDKDRHVPNTVVIHPPTRNAEGEWV